MIMVGPKTRARQLRRANELNSTAKLHHVEEKATSDEQRDAHRRLKLYLDSSARVIREGRKIDKNFYKVLRRWFKRSYGRLPTDQVELYRLLGVRRGLVIESEKFRLFFRIPSHEALVESLNVTLRALGMKEIEAKK